MNNKERKQLVSDLYDDIMTMLQMMDRYQPDIANHEQDQQYHKLCDTLKVAQKLSLKKEVKALEELRDFLMDNFFVVYGESERGNALIKPIRLWLNEQIKSFGEPDYISETGLHILGRAA